MSRTLALAFCLFALAAPLAAYRPPTGSSGFKITTAWGDTDFRHAGGVLSLTVSKDHVVSGGKDGYVHLWDHAGHDVKTDPHGDLVLATALSPYGGRYAVAGTEGRIVISAIGSSLTTVLRGHRDWVQGLAWSPDNAFLVSASRDQEVRVWNALDGKLLHAIPGKMTASGAAAISPDSKQLAATSPAGVAVWSFQEIVKRGKKARPTATLPVHPGGTTAVAFEPKTPRLITAGADGVLQFWRLPDAALEARVPAHTVGVSSLAISPDGFHLATCGGDDLVKIWALDPATNPANMRCRALRLPEGRAHAVAFLDDATVIAGTESGSIVKLPVPAGSAFEAPATLTASPGGVVAMALSPDGTSLAVAESSRVVRLRDTATGQVTHTLNAGELVRALAWLPGGRLAAGGERAQVEILSPGGDVRVLGNQSPWVTALALSPDGKTLASGAGNATIKLWDLATAKETSTLVGHRAQIDGLAYLSDTRLVSISRDRRVGVWDVVEKKVEATLIGHESAITAMAADGRLVLTGGEDGEAYLWAPPAPRPIVKYFGTTSKGAVAAVSFGAPRSGLMVGQKSGAVRTYWVPQWPPAGPDAKIPEQKDGPLFALMSSEGDHVTASARLPDGRLVLGTARGALLVYK